MASKRKSGSPSSDGSDQEKKTLKSFICVLQTGERVLIQAETIQEAMFRTEEKYKPLIVIGTYEKI